MSDFTSDFWSIYIAVLTLFGIAACMVLLWAAGSTRRVLVNMAAL